jgi:hypothetical protein
LSEESDPNGCAWVWGIFLLLGVVAGARILIRLLTRPYDVSGIEVIGLVFVVLVLYEIWDSTFRRKR